MGRNGAGKSTTLKAIMGLLPPRGGRVRFAGQRHPRRCATYRIARLGLGYVPEDRRIFTDLTVYENLEVGRRAAPAAAAPPGRPSGCSRSSPTSPRCAAAAPAQMSGGEQQMLTIARTLMGNPEAVLLDEPSEGLAPVIVEQMAEAVLRMKAEGIAVLLSRAEPAISPPPSPTAPHHREGRGALGRHASRRSRRTRMSAAPG